MDKIIRKSEDFEGWEGQDRDNYTDEQDRKSYAIDKDTEVTRVIFRRWDNGDIIALFPDLCEDVYGNPNVVRSYEHVGQHGSADYAQVIAITKPVKTSEEYNPLLTELEDGFGYNLKVCKRR